MTSFLIPAFLLLVLVLVLLLRPFIFPPKVEATSRRQMNAAIYREELEKLEAERTAGSINSTDYEIAHAEMRQRLFQDTNEEDDRSVMGSSKITVIGLCVFITVLSAGFYFSLGDATRIAEKNAEKPMTQEQKAAYVIAMAACAMAEIAGMQAENQNRAHRGESVAYTEDAFRAVIESNGIHHNAVIGMFRG
jgi:cytochrome c-type biogenesis protein CcmH